MDIVLSQPKRKRSDAKVRRAKRARKSKNAYDVVRSRFEIPDEAIVKMIYCDSVTRTVAGGLDDYLLNLNSIFDPDSTGAGHQPLGRDEWATFYGKYHVLSCSWDVWYSDNAPANIGSLVTIFPSNSGTSAVGLGAQEQARGVTKVVTGVNTAVGDAPVPIHFKGSMDLHTLTGVPKATYANREQYGAAFGSNPNELLALHIASRTLGGVNQLAQITFKLVYTVKLSDRLQMIAS